MITTAATPTPQTVVTGIIDGDGSIGKINHFSRAPRASISSHLARVPTGRASQPPPHASAGCSGGRLAGLPPVAQRTTQAASSGPSSEESL
jgi:hypothetical protein